MDKTAKQQQDHLKLNLVNLIMDENTVITAVDYADEKEISGMEVGEFTATYLTGTVEVE